MRRALLGDPATVSERTDGIPAMPEDRAKTTVAARAIFANNI
jgi:hypothetical protein